MMQKTSFFADIVPNRSLNHRHVIYLYPCAPIWKTAFSWKCSYNIKPTSPFDIFRVYAISCNLTLQFDKTILCFTFMFKDLSTILGNQSLMHRLCLYGHVYGQQTTALSFVSMELSSNKIYQAKFWLELCL